MEKELKELLKTVLANQAVIYNQIEDLINKQNRITRSTDKATYLNEMKEKAAKFRTLL